MPVAGSMAKRPPASSRRRIGDAPAAGIGCRGRDADGRAVRGALRDHEVRLRPISSVGTDGARLPTAIVKLVVLVAPDASLAWTTIGVLGRRLVVDERRRWRR